MKQSAAAVNHFEAMCFADQYIMERNWHDALACLFSVLVVSPAPSGGGGNKTPPQKEESVEPPPPAPEAPLAGAGVQHHPHLIKRAARLYAEINGALPNGDPRKQEAAAAQLLLLSRVKANEWLGTQGVAAAMLGVESTRIGNIEMDYTTGMPLLIQADNYCAACQKPGVSGRCSKCGLAWYCCEKHQRDDWPLHKVWCSTSRMREALFWNSTEPYQERLQEVRRAIAHSLEEAKKN